MKNKVITNFSHCSDSCYFGVDFTGSSLRLLQLENKGDDFEIIGWSQKKIPKGVINQGNIVKKEDFIEIFKESLESVHGSFSGSNIMLTIPEEKVFTRVISVPSADDEKSLEETIKWETESSIPVAISELYYDWQILKKEKNKVDVLVMASNKDIIDNYLDIFDGLGFKVIALEPESLSMARSLITKKFEDYALLVYLGTDSSNFAICKKNTPVFTANSSISGKMMTEVVVKELGVSFEKAERYKIKKGLESSQVNSKNSRIIFNSLLETLVKEMKKTIEFLQENLFSKEKNKKITKIILCGGGSNLKGLSSYLTVKLRQPVTQSNPWINLNFVKKIPPISKQNSQGFAPVIGLTLKAQDYEKID
ncbi:MAG: type IV pilus assembly protein PilM [Candidatus Moranbacteria bacterium]|nr:type IV pilus assembly protein PilM [Candidatus Moranbacteria bacterium]